MEKKFVYEVTLKERLEEITQDQLAKELGITKGAVWQMIRAERRVLLKKIKGKWHYFEYKDWKHGKSKVAA